MAKEGTKQALPASNFNRELYNHLSQTYDSRQENPATLFLRKKELGLIRRFSKGLVVDLGCGTGHHLNLAENVIGLDISEKMLNIAKSKNKPLTQGNIKNLPFKDASADTIYYFFSTLNFVGLDCVREVSRTVKTGGKILLSVTSVMDIDKSRSSPEAKVKKFRIDGKPVNTRLFEKGEIVERFREEGFKLVNFGSIFRLQKPRWGNFQPFSFWEKLKLKTETLLPK
ncbi:MAG TPA: class I SAM-dependent methyltransferase, partial [archaeon]|nr:class I SAM-dependent methyltransferase [archaeon]